MGTLRAGRRDRLARVFSVKVRAESVMRVQTLRHWPTISGRWRPPGFGSLVAERHHRVQPRGFVRGPDAEEQADGYRDYDA